MLNECYQAIRLCSVLCLLQLSKMTSEICSLILNFRTLGGKRVYKRILVLQKKTRTEIEMNVHFGLFACIKKS